VAKLPRWTERVGENAQTMAVLRADLEQSVGRHQRAIEALTGHIGRPGVLYGMIVCAWLWMLYNTLAPWLHLTQLDAPPFFWLQGAFCFVALTVTLLVLITQNRQEHRAERYAQLDLQINMLAEQKEAKIIALLEELRRDLPMVRNRRDSVAEAMIEPTNHQEVFLALEASMEYVVVKE
jgi:uncharacterized membrane protein